MDIQNNGVNNIHQVDQTRRSSRRPTSDVQERSGNLSDSMNAYAYLGQSQIVHKKYTRPTPPTVPNGLDLSAEDLKPITLVENKPLTKEDAIEFLQRLGFSDSAISKIDFSDPKILMTSTAYKNLLESSSEEEQDAAINEIKEYDEEKQLEIFEEQNDLLKYYNKENLETLSKYYDGINRMDDMWSILSNLTDRDEEETNLILEKLPLIVSVQGKLDDKNYFRGDINKELFEQITPEKAKLIKEINAFIPEKDRMPAVCANKLDNNDNIDKYLALMSKYVGDKTLSPRSVLPTYRNETIPQLNEKLEAIDDILSQYPMDFGQNECDINTIYDLVQSDEPKIVQEFVNGLSKEAKNEGINIFGRFKDKMSKEQILDICNTIFSPEYGHTNKDKIFNYIEQQPAEDIYDIIETIKLCKGTDNLGFYAEDHLTPPQGDRKAYNKLLGYRSKFEEKNLKCYGSTFDSIIRNPKAIPEEVTKIFDYHLEKGVDLALPWDRAFTQPKGAYEYILYNEFPEIEQHRYSDYYKDKLADLSNLAQSIENDEEFELVRKLTKPDNNVVRFKENHYDTICDFKQVKEVLELYRQDKDSTLAILDMKNKDGYYKFNKLDDVKNMVSAYQIDKDFIPEILAARPYISTSDLKDIVEAKQIDADYTRELLTKENPNEKKRNNGREPYRLRDNQIKAFVECSQIRENTAAAERYKLQINEMIAELKKSQPLLPVTKMPKSSRVKEAITQVNADGSTNIKGVYIDKSGLVVIKFNEVEDWDAIGVPNGTTKGYLSTGYTNVHKEDGRGKETVGEEIETGNIKFFVHGLDYSNQLAKFDAFALPDTDALLSVSWAERPETKYRFFRPQGIMLDARADYVYGGGNTDAGSGFGKNIDNFKNDYVFGGYREGDRKYISELIKDVTGMSDDEYVAFVEKNKDIPMSEIEPADVREKIIKKLATINSNERKGERSYNEMYLSYPKGVMGVFAYDMDPQCANLKKGALQFLENIDGRTDFLKQYALEHDVPFYLFGD